MFQLNKIWKLQRPLLDTREIDLVMAYTENNEQMAMIPMPEEFIDELFQDESKIYVKAKIVNGVLKVKHKIESQDW